MSDSLRPVDCSPSSSSVHGILQARVLEWVAISFSRVSSRPRDQTQVSHIAGRRFNLCTTREPLKYKNPSTNIKDFKGGKEARLKEEGGGGGRGGPKGVALQIWTLFVFAPPRVVFMAALLTCLGVYEKCGISGLTPVEPYFNKVKYAQVICMHTEVEKCGLKYRRAPMCMSSKQTPKVILL